MNFDSFAAFLHMGGHGSYVWSAYGLAGATLVINVLAPWWRRRRYLHTCARRLRRERNQ